MQYPAPGALALAERAVALLSAAGLISELDPTRGLDHGAWAPLSAMYPQANIPVTQLSLVHDASAAQRMLRWDGRWCPCVMKGCSSLRLVQSRIILAGWTLMHKLKQRRCRKLSNLLIGLRRAWLHWMLMAYWPIVPHLMAQMRILHLKNIFCRFLLPWAQRTVIFLCVFAHVLLMVRWLWMLIYGEVWRRVPEVAGFKFGFYFSRRSS
jgi:hypothetical protein